MSSNRHLATDPNTPPKILAKLSGDTDVVTRWNVASNPNTSLEILIKLASNTDEWVRQNVARNQNTPLETLTRLSDDIADNPSTSPETLSQLDALEAAYLVTNS